MVSLNVFGLLLCSIILYRSEVNSKLRVPRYHHRVTSPTPQFPFPLYFSTNLVLNLNKQIVLLSSNFSRYISKHLKVFQQNPLHVLFFIILNKTWFAMLSNLISLSGFLFSIQTCKLIKNNTFRPYIEMTWQLFLFCVLFDAIPKIVVNNS